MRRFERVSALACAALCSAGCATSAVDLAPERADRPWNPTTNAAGEILPGRGDGVASTGYVLPANASLASAAAQSDSGIAIDATKVYSLADLIDLAETNNPITRIAWNDARRVALAAGIACSTYLPRVT